MPKYITHPDIKITLGTTEHENRNHISLQIIRHENGFDTATIMLSDYLSELYPDVVTYGTAIQVDIKDSSDSSYPTNPIFKGVVRYPNIPYSVDGEVLILKCDGAGYGIGDTACAQEYGTQSANPSLDTIKEILTDATHGIIPKYVNKMLGSATDSGFSYTTTGVQTITGTIPYQLYPYKPCNKALDDLCDIVTALKDGGAGPHWIVTTDDDLKVKLIGSNIAGWSSNYDGGTSLYQGTNILDYKFEKIGPEANYVLYYGAWRRPSNGDMWTENNSASWEVPVGASTDLSDESGASDHRVNNYAIKMTSTSAVDPWAAIYPSGGGLGYDFSSFREYNVPSFNFWCKHDGLSDAAVRLSDNAGNYFEYDFFSDIINTNQWYHISIPIGDHYATAGGAIWDDTHSGTWDDIDYIAFFGSHANTKSLYVDGMHFGDAWVCRGAYNSTNITANKLKIKPITDNVGKDDTLDAADDSGLIAQMAYSELLRLQTTSLVGYVTIPLIGDVLPGQQFSIYAKKNSTGSYNINGTAMRTTKIIHDVLPAKITSTLFLTDDVLNSHPRTFYEDFNKMMAATRPEFQDRQTTSMKAGHIDIRVPLYAKDYA